MTEQKVGAMEDKRHYKVTADNKVVGPEGTIYNEGEKSVAEEIAAFLNDKKALEEALDAVLEAHDYPLSGTEWREIQRKCRSAIRGEQA